METRARQLGHMTARMVCGFICVLLMSRFMFYCGFTCVLFMMSFRCVYDSLVFAFMLRLRCFMLVLYVFGLCKALSLRSGSYRRSPLGLPKWYPWKEVPTWRVQATLTRSGYLSGAMRMSRCDRSMANVRMTEKLLSRRWTKSAARVLLRSHVSRWDVVVYVRGGGVYLPNNNINIGDNINIWFFMSGIINQFSGFDTGLNL